MIEKYVKTYEKVSSSKSSTTAKHIDSKNKRKDYGSTFENLLYLYENSDDTGTTQSLISYGYDALHERFE